MHIGLLHLEITFVQFHINTISECHRIEPYYIRQRQRHFITLNVNITHHIMKSRITYRQYQSHCSSLHRISVPETEWVSRLGSASALVTSNVLPGSSSPQNMSMSLKYFNSHHFNNFPILQYKYISHSRALLHFTHRMTHADAF